LHLFGILVKFEQILSVTVDEVGVITEEERKTLLRAAREAIVCGLKGKEVPNDKGIPSTLTELRGAFVTLHEEGKLRGCIGYIEPVKPLITAVREVAAKSALEDPRFPPLTEKELDHVQIEISVLSLPERVSDIETIEIGKHGLIVELAGHRGLLLPQVALENGWDRAAFLQNIVLKAGLPPDAWKHPAAILYKFSAEVFGEDPSANREAPR